MAHCSVKWAYELLMNLSIWNRVRVLAPQKLTSPVEPVRVTFSLSSVEFDLIIDYCETQVNCQPTIFHPRAAVLLHLWSTSSASNMIVLVYSPRGGSERVQRESIDCSRTFSPNYCNELEMFFFLQICFSKTRLRKHWSIYTLTMFSGVCGFLLWL